MSSPVLEEIKALLVTVPDDLFDADIIYCLGKSEKNKNGGRRCRRAASNESGRGTVRQLKESFIAQREVPHDDEFYADVERFLHFTHCHDHREEAFKNLENWKQTRLHPVASVTSTSPAVHETPAPDQDEANLSLLDSNLEVPEQAVEDTTHVDAASDSASSRTNSHGEESDNTFSLPSPASTANATPAPTPLHEAAGPASPAANSDSDSESRPNTPTPPPRNPDPHVQGTNPAPDKRDDVLAEHADRGCEVLGGINHRFNSVKRKKWGLLKAIESKFKGIDFDEGKVYVWTHKENVRLVKIGWSRVGSKGRRSQGGNCYAASTKPHWESEEKFVGAYRVEQIAKAQLGERNIPLVECVRCKKGHTEWFEMDVTEAVTLLEDWTMFVKSAYVDGRLSEDGERLMNRVCNIKPQELVRAILDESGICQTENDAAELAVVSEESEAEAQTVLVGERVNAPHGEERISATANADPILPSADQVSTDPLFQQDEAFAAVEVVSPIPDWRSRLQRRKIWQTLVSATASRTHSKQDGTSKEGSSIGDRGEELFARVVGRFYSSELRQVDERLHQNQLGQTSDMESENSRLGRNMWVRIRNLARSPRFRSL